MTKKYGDSYSAMLNRTFSVPKLRLNTALIFSAVVMLTASVLFFATVADASSQVSSGSGHSLSIKPDGSAWAWGYNGHGQLGDGTRVDRLSPVQVSGLDSLISISAGNGFSVAVKSDGTVWTWGLNSYGQLGDGTRDNRSVPRSVPGLTDIMEVSAGHSHVLALRRDGTVWAWGLNSNGQLGNATFISSSIPVRVEGLTGASSISAGFAHSLALARGGSVWAWGFNDWGQLGDNTNTWRNRPVQIRGIERVQSVKAGFFHTVALKEDGTVWTWGQNSSGQLGLGTSRIGRIAPEHVKALDAIIAVDAGDGHTVALSVDGTVWAWGNNLYGQLGLGNTTSRKTPQKVMIEVLVEPGREGDEEDNGDPIPPVYDYRYLLGVQSISAGGNNTLALNKDGALLAWGYNRSGGLGDGTTEDKLYPVAADFITTINVRANLHYAGTVSGQDAYEHAQIATVRAIPNEGYSFVNWTEGGKIVSTKATYSFTVTGDRALVANFSDVYDELSKYLYDQYRFYTLTAASVGTVDQGRISDRYEYEASGGKDLIFILGWKDRASGLRLSVYDPQGRLHKEVIGHSPVAVTVNSAAKGLWTFSVGGVNVPHNRYPFTVIVGEKGFTGTLTFAPYHGKGDVNGDGRIDINDVILVMKHILGEKNLDANQQLLADVNGDGIVNIHDAALIRQKSLGLTDTF